MKAATQVAWRVSAPWLILALAAIVVLGLRLQLSFDLSAFFPRQTSLAHDVLLEQMRNGPGSRLLVIGISGAPQDQLARFSDELRQVLHSEPVFASVQNGEFSDGPVDLPEPINSYYLLMQDVDYGQSSLHSAVRDRLQDLAFAGGDLLGLIARDPFLVTLDIVERLTPVYMSGDMWFAADGTAVLMAETRAASIDIEAQAEAISVVRSAVSNLATVTRVDLEITGVGAFSVELQKTIRAEAQKRSLLAVTALALVLLFFYRQPRYILLATLPIGMGFLTGLAVVSLVFDSVHGITLAFGFTLMGVAIDYPLHLFSHSRTADSHAAIGRIWRTMRLGAASTAIAYLALALSGSDGLAQLGVFTASGILVAVLVTRSWLPSLLPRGQPVPQQDQLSVSPSTLRYGAAIVVLGIALLIGRMELPDGLWNDNLTSLSPVPAQRLQIDAALRSAAGTPDMRYQLVSHNSSLESLLEAGESIDRRLAVATQDKLIDDWQSVTQILPSHQTQLLRQQAIPDQDALRDRLSDVLADTPFRSDAFAPFVNAASNSKKIPPLLPEDIIGTPLQSWLSAHLIRVNEQWVSLISLSNPDPAGLAERIQSWGEILELVDLKQSSTVLLRDYRESAVITVSIAAFLIVLLLLQQRRNIRQIFWITLTVAAALAVTIVAIAISHDRMTVIHLVALLLVTGLGLDYALFLSRSETVQEKMATDQAVLVCAVSTTVAFGILAASTIPVLKFLGLTVAVGSASSYLLAVAGSRLPRKFSH